MGGKPRWLLGRLSHHLKHHHLAYTCRVKKHGTILYRQGRELDALSHSLFSLKACKCGPSEPDYVNVCTNLSSRVRAMADTCKASTGLLNIEQQIQSVDPALWDMVCILTESVRERVAREQTKKPHPQVYEGNAKNLRRLFIIHQLMFCLDATCSNPFHILLADVIDCHGGGSELIKIFNRFGVCASYDTLLRHIQGTVQHLRQNGLLHGINCNNITFFSFDNVDFLHSSAQVFCGRQQLSWHGTTVQAIQSKPSLDTPSSRRRSHALLSPTSSPDKAAHSPLRKRNWQRTWGTTTFPTSRCCEWL